MFRGEVEPGRPARGRPAEIGPGQRADTVVADGYLLPLADGAADVCFSSNVLEHVADPHTFLGEMARVTRPARPSTSRTPTGSPRGAATSGRPGTTSARRARRRYERRTGRPAKHRLGENLFAIGVGETLPGFVRGRSDVAVLSARSRYWPVLPQLVPRIPLLREFATWNLLLILRRCS
ncbi:class I SAM-dependent methyltransferase [Streptomyces californicus]